MSNPTETPFRSGTASHASHETYHTQREYKKFLKADTDDSQRIPFDELLSIIFDFPTDMQEIPLLISKIASSSDFKALLNEYSNENGPENLRYKKFNALANFTLKALWEACPSDAKPQPIALSRHDFLKDPKRKDVENVASNDPKDAAFHWVELLTFFEFKKKPPKNTIEDFRKALLKRENGSQSGASHSGAASSSATSATFSTMASVTTNASQSDESVFTSQLSTSTAGQKRQGGDDIGGASASKKRKVDKPKKEVPEVSIAVQCASYALEMMSYGGFRTHAVGVVVFSDYLRLLYYDRSVTVKSSSIDFSMKGDPTKLVAMLYCMQRATPRQWGLVRTITPDPESYTGKESIEYRDLVRGMLLTLNNGVVLKLGDLIFLQHALIGRGTCVATAEPIEAGTDWKDKKIVVKFSFTPKTRTAEGVVLANIVKKVEERQEDKWMFDHLPEVLHYESLAPTASDVQTLLSAYFTAKSSDVYEDRVLQVMVMTEQLPITELTTSETLISAIRDVFKCYRWLYETAGIMHRDISVNNVMFRKKGDQIHGVLSDYDLVLELQNRDLGPSSKNRTGTRPYMALDLLNIPPMAHQYRHDLESLYYVLVVLTTGYKDGPLNAWCKAEAHDDSRALYMEKKLFILDQELPPLSDPFQRLENIIELLGSMFQAGYLAQGAGRRAARKAIDKGLPTPLFDESTLGGHVDFDKFKDILSHSIASS